MTGPVGPDQKRTLNGRKAVVVVAEMSLKKKLVPVDAR